MYRQLGRVFRRENLRNRVAVRVRRPPTEAC